MSAAVLVAAGLAPEKALVGLATRASKDGQLAPATLRILSSLSRIALPLGLASIALLAGHRHVAAALYRLFEQLARPTPRAFVMSAVCLAALVRFAWILAVPSMPVTDYLEYDNLALRLLETRQYLDSQGQPTAFRPPGYPVLLAGLHAVFGAGLWAPKILKVLLSAGIVAMTYLLGRRAAGESTARLAATLVAVCPSQIGYTSILCTEIPFTFLLLLFLFVIAKLGENAGRRVWICSAGAGLLLGLTAMVRSQVALLPAATFIVQVWRNGWRRAFGVHVLLALGMSVPVVFWGMRNVKAVGAFVPFSTNAGVNFYYGNNPWTNGTGLEFGDGVVPDETLVAKSESERNRLGFRLGFRFYREHPLQVPVLAARKIVMMMIGDGAWTHWAFDETARPMPRAARPVVLVVANAFYWLILVLFGLEVLVFRGRRSARASTDPYLDAFLLYTAVITAFWLGQERYHFPLVPVLCICAATFLARIAASTNPSETANAPSEEPHVRTSQPHDR